MSKCRTCEYALYDGMCLAQGKFTLLDAPACDDYKPRIDVEVSKLKAENAKLRELCIDFASMLSYAGLGGLVVEAHIGGTAKTYDASVLCDMAEKLWDEVDA